MIMQTTRSVFNPVQLHILEMFNYCKTDESMEELKNVLSDFYAQKVQKEADRLWDSGQLNGEAIERILEEHWTMPQH
jgi:hypothetical protein